MKIEKIFNATSAAPATPAARKHTDSELIDYLKMKELTPLEAFAKRQYAAALTEAIKDDESQSIETRAAENFVRPAALLSLAVLRAVGAKMQNKE